MSNEPNLCRGCQRIFAPGMIIQGRCPLCRQQRARRAYQAKVRKHGFVVLKGVKR